MLTSLAEKIHPQVAALVLIDVQNDFCSPGGAFAKLGYDISMVQEMIPRLVKLVEEARKAGVPIIYVQSTYNTEPNLYLSEVWIEHKLRRQAKMYVEQQVCKQGTWGWEYVKPLQKIPPDAIIEKHRYDAFLHTNLELVLRTRKIKSLILAGATTNVCVETTARSAFLRDYYVVFTNDCTASHDPSQHGSTLFNIEKYFGIVVSSDQIIDSWHAMNSVINSNADSRDLKLA
jgi:ureidoacrylate peracid hydrolase